MLRKSASLLTVALAAFYFVFAISGSADAGPLAPLIMASGWFTGLPALMQTVVAIGMSLAATALQMMMMKKPPEGGGLSSRDTATGEAVPQSFMVGGQYATAGSRVVYDYYHDERGTGKPNDWLIKVTALSDLGMTSLDAVWLNGQRYAVSNESPDPVYGKRLISTAEDNVNGNLFVRFYDGSQTTADAELVTRYGVHDDRPWSSDMIGTGTAYAIISAKFHEKKFSGFPDDLLYEGKGAKFYDPRLDSTNGGSGPCRWGQPSTYVFTKNPIVVVYNLVRGVTLPDGTIYGLNAGAREVSNPTWFAAMNECDTLVPIAGGGTEPQFECAYEIKVDREPNEVILELLKSCAGKIVEYGGFYSVVAGAPSGPVATITDGDVIIDEPRDYTHFAGLENAFNGVTATYPDPRNAFQETESPTYSRAEWIAADDGRELFADLSLPAVTNPRQVRRLQRMAGADNRRDRVHTITLPFIYLYLEPLDTISWNSPFNGYAGKLFEITSKSIDPLSLTVTVVLRERDNADYNRDSWSDSVIASFPLSRPTIPTITSVAGFTATGIALNVDGKPRNAAIRVNWDSTEQSFTAIAYEVTLASDSSLVTSGEITDVSKGVQNIKSSIVGSTNYRVRMRGISRTRNTVWSNPINVTTPAVFLTNDDFEDGITSLFADAGITAPRDIANPSIPGTKVGELAWIRSLNKLMYWDGTKWIDPIQNDLDDITESTQEAIELANNIVSVDALPPTGDVNKFYLHKGQKKLYRWTGSAWVGAVDAQHIQGTLTSDQIQSIQAAKIAGQIDHTKLADNAVQARSLAAGAVSNPDKLGDNVIVARSIQVGAVGARELAAEQISAKHLVVSDWTNLVADSDVQDLSQWVGWSGSHVALNANYGVNNPVADSKGAFIVSPRAGGAATNIISKSVPAKAGEQYFASGKVGATGPISVRLHIQYLDANGAGVGTAFTPIKTTSAFETLAVSLEAPVGTASVRMYYLVLANGYATTGGANPHIVFAGPQLRRKNGGELIVDGTIQANHIKFNTLTGDHVVLNSLVGDHIAINTLNGNRVQAGTLHGNRVIAGTLNASTAIIEGTVTAGLIQVGAIGADQLAARAVSASKLAIADFQNYVPDDQIQDEKSWSKSAAVSVRPVTPSGDVKSVGDLYYNHTTGGGADQQIMTAGFFPVTPADELYVSGQMIRVGGTVMNTRIQILFYDKNDVLIPTGAVATIATLNGAANTATPYENSVVVPAGAFQARYRFVVLNSGTDATGIVFGAPVVKVKGTGKLIVDGTIKGLHIEASTITGGLLASTGIITGTAQIGDGLITNAKIANLTVGGAKIQNLTVETIKIADRAITDHVVDDLASKTLSRGVTGQIAHTMTFNLAQPAAIIFGGYFEARKTSGGSAGNSSMVSWITLDGVELSRSRDTINSSNIRSYDFQRTAQLAAGNHTIRIMYSSVDGWSGTPGNQTPANDNFFLQNLNLFVFRSYK